MGIAAKKRKLAKHKFPWTKLEQKSSTYLPRLDWKRGGFAALR